MAPRLSVIIPTHKRADILRTTLDRLAKQTVKDQIEAIVVSDGKDDKTRALFDASTWPMPVRFLEIPKRQQGVARNVGMREAQGEYCLFIGDDIFLEKGACEVHARPREDNTAVLGFTTWDTSLSITPAMRWLEKSGWQFGYPMIETYAHGFIPIDIQHRFTYTSHISLPMDIARAHPFREDVMLYGWEDVEWGQRLAASGVRLFYEPDAKALHHHPLTLEESLQRMETLGESAVHLSRIAPGLDRLPRGWKYRVYQFLAIFPTMRGKHARAFLRGIERQK